MGSAEGACSQGRSYSSPTIQKDTLRRARSWLYQGRPDPGRLLWVCLVQGQLNFFQFNLPGESEKGPGPEWVVLETVAIAKVIAKASAGVHEAEFADKERCGGGASQPDSGLFGSFSPCHPLEGRYCDLFAVSERCTTISFLQRALLLKASRSGKLLELEQCFSDIDVCPDDLGTLRRYRC